jgi:hypothetical protein
MDFNYTDQGRRAERCANHQRLAEGRRAEGILRDLRRDLCAF